MAIVNPLDEEDEGEISFDEPSDAEQDLAPDPPSAPETKQFEEDPNFESATDVHPDTLQTFVVCVLLANAAVLAVSLGALFWYFRGRVQLGVGLLIAGTLGFLRVYQHYRAWEKRRQDRDEQTIDDENAGADADRNTESDVQTSQP